MLMELLAYAAIYVGVQVLTFRKSLLPPSSGWSNVLKEVTLYSTNITVHCSSHWYIDP